MRNPQHDRMILIIMTILLTSAIWSPCVAASEDAKQIFEIQHAISAEGAEWEAGITSVSHLSPEEKRNLTLRWGVPKPTGEIMSVPRALQHEERFDWRDWGVVTPVRSQRNCGSCWAFGSVAAAESAFLKYSNLSALDLSEQHLVSDCTNTGDCSGGWPNWALDYIRDTGIPDEACYPYTANNTICNPCVGWKDCAYQISDYLLVEPSTDDYKYALKKYGPMVVVLLVPEDWYYYRSGIYSPVRRLGWANHVVLLVGWNDSDDCWIIKNSWGTKWGEQGYARVKYGDLEKYNYAYAITGVEDIGAAPAPAGWFKPVGAVASSEHSEKYCAGKAIDNDTTTHWFSDPSESSPSITFDLGEIITINKTRLILHYYDVPATVDIAGSVDMATWHPLAAAVNVVHGAAYVEIPITQAGCRYVRVTQTDTKRGYGTCTEFDVHCVDAVVPDPIMATITITYPDRTEVITLDKDLMSILLSEGESKMFEWWAPHVDG